ncbi:MULTISPECIES: adenylate/guanylate cyclase domain-containing protein [unclassified Phaeobacter]|uniref:adenylate/guanylate cyclase domain-containing protein n=1 Tax=unclassified Phaeobacter TaxID=2621772 RepID=UPI003A88EB2C
MTEEKISRIAHAIVEDALSEFGEASVLERACRRLLEAGVPLVRFNASQPVLHPTIGGYLHLWTRDGGGIKTESWLRASQEAGTDFSRTPFYKLIYQKADSLRYPLFGISGYGCFPLLEKLQQDGGTDYFALRISLGTGMSLGPARIFLTSWATDRPGGFEDWHLEVIKRIAQTLALVIKTSSNQQIGRNVVRAYLGKNAAETVFNGQIERGAGQSIQAALWSSDLQGFTKISDEVPRDQLLNMVNDYFECVVDSVHRYGGNILKFMGDGVLAVFDKGSDALSTCAAAHAAEHLRRQITRLTTARRDRGLPATGLYLGLHLGEVHYGNVGSPNRLDFTVTGPAVNELSRIEGMCRKLNRDIVISEAFARSLTVESIKLSSLGSHELRGVREPKELFSLESFGTLLC